MTRLGCLPSRRLFRIAARSRSSPPLELEGKIRIERGTGYEVCSPRSSGDEAMPSRIDSWTYGTQKETTGLDFVQVLADGTLPLNTTARTLGYDITDAETGRVVVTAVPKDT